MAPERLTKTALAQLRRLALGPRIYRIGCSTLQALERRNLIAGNVVASLDPCKKYSITDLGRRTLKEQGR